MKLHPLFLSLVTCAALASEPTQSSATGPDLLDFRTKPIPPNAPELYLTAPLPGRLTLSLNDQILADERGENPIAFAKIPSSASSGETWIMVRFAPSDGSPGTERLLNLPAGTTLSILDLIQPSPNQPDWLFRKRTAPPEPKTEPQPEPIPIVETDPPVPVPAAQDQITSAQNAADWLLQQSWLSTLAQKQPRGVTLTLHYALDPESPDAYVVEIRTKHAPDSGFDPNLSPVLARFRIMKKDGTILHYDVAQDTHLPVESFLEAYHLVEPAPAEKNEEGVRDVPVPPVAPGYTARLSRQDRLNSKGQPLTQLSEILRQDRANFHRFQRRDSEDSNDPWFESAPSRAFFETARIEVLGGQAVTEKLLREDALIQVEKDNNTLRVRLLRANQ